MITSRFHVGALAHFFGDLKFAETVPDEPGLLHFLRPDFSGLDVQLEAFPGKGTLLALEVKSAQRSEAQHHGMQREGGQQNAA